MLKLSLIHIFHGNTVAVVSAGVMLFAVAAYCAQAKFGPRRIAFQINKKSLTICRSLEIQRWKLLLVLIFNICVIILVSREVARVVSGYGYSGTIFYLMGRYANLNKYTTDNVALNSWVQLCYTVCKGCGYIWGYVLMNQLALRRKINKLLLLCYVSSLASCLLTGSRTIFLYSLLGLLPAYLINRVGVTGKIKTEFRSIIKIVGVVFLVFISFMSLGQLIGRVAEQYDFFSYIEAYLGAPLANLDQFLQKTHSSPKWWGYNTFGFQYNYLGAKLGRPEWKYVLDLPEIRYGTVTKSNVYTTFYAFIYDFGYLGMVLVPIMGFLMGWLYKKANQGAYDEITISKMLYTYEFSCVMFCFFSNRIYESFTITIVRFVLIWMAAKYFIFDSRLDKLQQKSFADKINERS